MEQIKEDELSLARTLSLPLNNSVQNLDKEVQTEVDYPTETAVRAVEIIKEVPVVKEIVREVRVREDADKIEDTDISRDANGHFKIFERLHNADDIGDE